jgi:hypothetical protein
VVVAMAAILGLTAFARKLSVDDPELWPPLLDIDLDVDVLKDPDNI